MSTTLFQSLNARFTTDKKIADVLKWRQTGQFPDWAPRNFNAKYRQFVARDGQLVYEPENLVVVPKAQTEATLQRIYRNKEIGLAKGIGSMYKYIQMHFCNITRDEVSAFMKKQSNYQLGQPPKERVNKPFTASSPNSLWCADLLDLNPYTHNNRARYRYILTVIDIFSRRVFLGKLINKDAPSTKAALEAIVRRAGVAPSRILTDLGTEFQGQFAAYCDANDIKMSKARPHQPKSNGVVERANKEVRSRLRALFIANQDLDWVRELHVIERNINNSYHSSIGCAPIDIWKNTRGMPDKDELDRKTAAAIKRVAARNRAKIDAFRETGFKVGDRVRVTMSSMYTATRQTIKAGNRKAVVVQFDPTIYVVAKVIVPRDGISRPRYILNTLDGKQLRISETVEKEFYASDMVLAPPADIEAGSRAMTVDRALQLNGGRRMASDIEVFGGRLYFGAI